MTLHKRRFLLAFGLFLILLAARSIESGIRRADSFGLITGVLAVAAGLGGRHMVAAPELAPHRRSGTAPATAKRATRARLDPNRGHPRQAHADVATANVRTSRAPACAGRPGVRACLETCQPDRRAIMPATAQPRRRARETPHRSPTQSARTWEVASSIAGPNSRPGSKLISPSCYVATTPTPSTNSSLTAAPRSRPEHPATGTPLARGWNRRSWWPCAATSALRSTRRSHGWPPPSPPGSVTTRRAGPPRQNRAAEPSAPTASPLSRRACHSAPR